MSVVKALNTLIITKDIGGQAILTNDIENYPAFEHVLIENP
jgi:thioredoxin reductase